MKNTTIILDYGYGNIYSLKSSLLKLGIETHNTRNIEQIIKAKLIILPGVASFQQAMTAIKNLKLDIAIKQALQKKSKIIGICLGYQMLFTESEEFGVSKGLGIIKGKVKGAIKRVPRAGSNLSNISQGGTAFKTGLSKKELKISSLIGKSLLKDKIYFAGIDLIDGYLIGDINVTSPTGLPQFKDLTGKNLAKDFWDGLGLK